MQILVQIDQTAALRAGIDAASSTAKVDINPAHLTPAQRDLLADLLVDGYDLTQKVVALDNGKRRILPKNYHGHRPVVLQPTSEALSAELDRLASALAADEAAAREAAERRAAEANERLRAIMGAEAEMESIIVRLDRDGNVLTSGHGAAVQRHIDVPALPYTGSALELATEAVAAEFQAWLDLLRQRRADLIKEAAAEMRENELAEWLEREQQKAAALEALDARLPGRLRERHAAGYATADEIDSARRRILREDAGFSPTLPDGYEGHRPDKLTDTEYHDLLAVIEHTREQLGDAAQVKARLWWRAARPGEEGDEDGEVADRVAVIRWQDVSGIQVMAVEPLE